MSIVLPNSLTLSKRLGRGRLSLTEDEIAQGDYKNRSRMGRTLVCTVFSQKQFYASTFAQAVPLS